MLTDSRLSSRKKRVRIVHMQDMNEKKMYGWAGDTAFLGKTRIQKGFYVTGIYQFNKIYRFQKKKKQCNVMCLND